MFYDGKKFEGIPEFSCCENCKHQHDQQCDVLYPHELHQWDFVCDFWRRKNSGAFRRKLRKQRKEDKERSC